MLPVIPHSVNMAYPYQLWKVKLLYPLGNFVLHFPAGLPFSDICGIFPSHVNWSKC